MSYSTNNIKHLVLATLVSLSLVAGVATAKGPGYRGSEHHSPIERMIEKLDLTDEQIAKVDELMDSRAANRSSKREARANIRELIDQGSIDEAAEQAASQARQRVYEMANFKTSLKQILTAEQLAKMEQQELRKKKRAERRRQNSGS